MDLYLQTIEGFRQRDRLGSHIFDTNQHEQELWIEMLLEQLKRLCRYQYLYLPAAASDMFHSRG